MDTLALELVAEILSYQETLAYRLVCKEWSQFLAAPVSEKWAAKTTQFIANFPDTPFTRALVATHPDQNMLIMFDKPEKDLPDISTWCHRLPFIAHSQYLNYIRYYLTNTAPEQIIWDLLEESKEQVADIVFTPEYLQRYQNSLIGWLMSSIHTNRDYFPCGYFLVRCAQELVDKIYFTETVFMFYWNRRKLLPALEIIINKGGPLIEHLVYELRRTLFVNRTIEKKTEERIELLDKMSILMTNYEYKRNSNIRNLTQAYS